MEIATEHYIDAKGMLCPLPVLKFKKYIKDLTPGDVIRIDTTDPDSVKDFNIFSEMKGYKIVSLVEHAKSFSFVIEI
ncbi:sulfurtransferase TusA family protein [Teredinibacter waterburyi]|jgi:Predicted redox protein, regulator of disulfide bond formation|uniref:sulfurtransferase TusA family protein n=1 Tax=Teredinibacter waterburyi TaxID=1500538 RepID=UPI00165F6CCF|nr:sulfurtransferase TusA family protein [Teredinibacter waterburyi]